MGFMNVLVYCVQVLAFSIDIRTEFQNKGHFTYMPLTNGFVKV